MAIGVAYIGERRFYGTSQKNHEELFNLIRSKYELKIYNFSKGERLNSGTFDDRFRSNSSSTECPYTTSGAIQLWDFMQARKQVLEDIFIKIRPDIWFTKNSMQVILEELEKVVNGENDVAFMGLDFLNHCDQLHFTQSAIGIKKIPDFLIISRKSVLASDEEITTLISNPGKQKSGNMMYRYILRVPPAETPRASMVSCQMYLLRKDYENPSNWQIYSDWTSQYHKSELSQKWVANNKKFIGKL